MRPPRRGTARDEGLVCILDNRILTKRYGKSFLNALPDALSTPELNIKLAEGEPHRLIAQMQQSVKFSGALEVITMDGLRVEYADGFGLARASNTTPVIVLRFEADSETALRRIQADFRAALQSVKPGVALPF